MDKGVQPECLTLRNITSDQCFMQDHGQEHYKNNATSGQYFMVDPGQERPQDSQTNSRTIYFAYLLSLSLSIIIIIIFINVIIFVINTVIWYL